MNFKHFCRICFLTCIWFNSIDEVKSQSNFQASFGYLYTPLHINRTNLTRWMTFPSVELGFKINSKMMAQLSYLGHDIRIKNHSSAEYRQYIETPHLPNYETALLYIGSKFSLTLLSDYIFTGLKYDLHSVNRFKISINGLIGYRFGETPVIHGVIKNPNWPNGYELKPTSLSSDTPGIKVSISPSIDLTKFAGIEIDLGSYIFLNWPNIQPFGSFQLNLFF